ncbi:MAG: methyltransferase domain-containing protein [Bdellovibrionales bacterium]|nr:methyltransferase domain-containing protein [Ramlibacter sp.]
MSVEIIGLHEWFETPPGRYLLEWERLQFDAAVADIFGYHALQLGLPALDALQSNRMPHRWLACETQPPLQPPLPPGHAPLGAGRTALVSSFCALPFPENSLDLVLLPHTLELNHEPHATLREVERVLVPEGRVIICGLNPASLWGLRQRRAYLYQKLGFGQLYLPREGDFIGYWRMRDWLRLLGFEVESGQFGCYSPSVGSEAWLNRFHWMDKAGPRWWPIFGAAYFLVAVKRVRGMKLLGPAWKNTSSLASAPVPLANKARPAGDTQKTTDACGHNSP